MLFRQLNLVVKQFNFLCPVFGSNSLLFRSDSTPPYNFVCHLSLRDGNLSSEPKFKSSLFLRSTCNLRRVMIKYKARARKEDTSVPLPAHPRRFTSAPYFHLSCNCAQISQRTLTSAFFKLSSNCEHWCNTSLFVADLRRFYQAASEYSKVNVASRASRRVNQIAF